MSGIQDNLKALWPVFGQKTPKILAIAGRSHLVSFVSKAFSLINVGNSYNDEERCVAAGYDNGDVKLFDLRNMSLRWETNVRNGVCAIEFDRRDIKMNKLVVAGLESQYRLFDVRTQHPTQGFAYLTEKVCYPTSKRNFKVQTVCRLMMQQRFGVFAIYLRIETFS